jgi:hypothetical protein
MSRLGLPLVAALACLQPACGAADSLSPDLPVEAGAAADAPAADQHAQPEAAPDGTAPGDAGPEAWPLFDGAVPDTGIVTTKECMAQGGALCTADRWDLCPPGFEPVAADEGHAGCGNFNQGWCCQAAPVTSCNMAVAANCVPDACSGCFVPSPDTSLVCEPGRACCVDLCN